MLFHKVVLFTFASQALAFAATRSPLAASLNTAAVELRTLKVRLNVFHGTDLDLRELKRDTITTLGTVSDVVKELSSGRRLNDMEARAVVGAAEHVLRQLSLLTKAAQPEDDLLSNQIRNTEASDFIDAAAQVANNLASAVESSTPRKYARIFRNASEIYLSRISEARIQYGSQKVPSRPSPTPLPAYAPSQTNALIPYSMVPDAGAAPHSQAPYPAAPDAPAPYPAAPNAPVPESTAPAVAAPTFEYEPVLPSFL